MRPIVVGAEADPAAAQAHAAKMIALYDAQPQAPSPYERTGAPIPAPVAGLPATAGDPAYLARMLNVGDPSYSAEVAPAARAVPPAPVPAGAPAPSPDAAEVPATAQESDEQYAAERLALADEFATHGGLTETTLARLQKQAPEATAEQFNAAARALAEFKRLGIAL
jgi:hypothetical protein